MASLDSRSITESVSSYYDETKRLAAEGSICHCWLLIWHDFALEISKVIKERGEEIWILANHRSTTADQGSDVLQRLDKRCHHLG